MNHFFRRISFSISLAALTTVSVLLQDNLHAQDEMYPCLDEQPRHHLGADVSFNTRDVFVGIVFHYANPFGEGYSILGTFSFRPYGKKMLVEDSPGIYLYLREERFSMLLGIERQVYLTPPFSLFLSLSGGLSVPHYRGTERGKAEGMLPVVSMGFQWSFPCGKYFAGDQVAVRLGGQYLDVSEDQFRAYASVLFSL